MSAELSLDCRQDQDDIFSFSNSDSSIVLAHISDYGSNTINEANVANLVASWSPDAVFTSGDNSYVDDDYAQNVGAYYGQFVSRGIFFPTPGNHDWDFDNLGGYREYFGSITGQDYYYTKRLGPIQIFFIDSDARQPNGNTSTSAQAGWLERALAASDSPWKIVTLHHPPIVSDNVHGPSIDLQWPFGAWGADIVYSGHAHVYERLIYDTNYIVNGLGGQPMYDFDEIAIGSQVRYAAFHGACKVSASPTRLVSEFFRYDGTLIDSMTLEK
jgi:tartrate-resistant acid phosphatase type 5